MSNKSTLILIIVVILAYALYDTVKDKKVFFNKTRITTEKESDYTYKTGNDTVLLSGFSAIESSGGANFVIQQDSIFSVVVKGSKEALENVSVTMSGKSLIIEESSNWISSVNSKDKYEILIRMPVLESIAVSGSSNVKVDSVFKQVQALNLDISGAGNFKLNIDVPKFTISSSGASNIVATGKVSTIAADFSGAGNVDALGLLSDSALISSSGAGAVAVWATKYLEIDASGVGSIKYKGDPVIEKDISGFANIKKVDE